MIFSAKKWEDSDELKKFIPVSAALSFEKVESSLNDAFSLFIVPLFGEELSKKFQNIYDDPEADELEILLLEECQRAIANLAFWYNYTELNIRITDQGFQRQEAENFKSTYKYQEDQLRTAFKNKGFNAIDRMIDFLDKHRQEFSEYEKSPAYACRTKAIVRKTSEVDEIYFINNSHLIFLRLKPFFKIVEETVLQPVLGVDLYGTLLKSIEMGDKDLGGTTVEELRTRCAQFVIMRAVAMLIRSTGSLTDRGLYFRQLLPDKEGNESENPVGFEQALSTAANVELTAKSYHDLLLTFIEEKLPEFFKGRQSRVFDRDNDHKKSVWL